MNSDTWFKLITSVLVFTGLIGCGSENARIDIQDILSKSKTYVGSGECKFCHLEHYDSWRNTLHSRTIMDVTQNRDALIAEIDQEVIREDLKKLKKD